LSVTGSFSLTFTVRKHQRVSNLVGIQERSLGLACVRADSFKSRSSDNTKTSVNEPRKLPICSGGPKNRVLGLQDAKILHWIYKGFRVLAGQGALQGAFW
jgi:hypothetical protein